MRESCQAVILLLFSIVWHFIVEIPNRPGQARSVESVQEDRGESNIERLGAFYVLKMKLEISVTFGRVLNK